MSSLPLTLSAIRPAMRRQAGASLIEVLVAILLVALGILSMGAMQLNATRVAKTSESRAMGALLVADLADRMRANRDGVLFRASAGAVATNQYAFTTAYPANGDTTVTGTADACDAPDANCTAPQMAAFDMLGWRRAVAASLPGGWARVSNVDTSVSGPNENAVEIWLMWVEPHDVPMAGDDQACPANMVGTATPGSTLPAPRCMYFRINL